VFVGWLVGSFVNICWVGCNRDKSIGGATDRTTSLYERLEKVGSNEPPIGNVVANRMVT